MNGPAQSSVQSGARLWDLTVDLAVVPTGGAALGPTVVLIHGSMDRQSAFRKLAKALSSQHRVLSYDRRGYASSVDVSGPFSMDYQLRDLAEIVAHQPCVLIGHSYGGAVALAFAEAYPHLVLGVVVYESPMSWEPWWPTDSGGSRAVAMADDPELAAEVFLKRFIGERLWNRLPDATRHARRQEGRALVGELGDLRSKAAWHSESIAVPVMSGVGTRARDYVRRAAEIIGSLPDSRFVEIEGAHHNAHSAEPTLFNELLIQPLLRRIKTGSWD